MEKYWIIDEIGNERTVQPAGTDRKEAVEKAYQLWTEKSMAERTEYYRRIDGRDFYIVWGPEDPKKQGSVDFQKISDPQLIEEILEMVKTGEFD